MRLLERVIVPFALLLCAGGAFLLLSGLAEKQTPHRLVIGVLMLMPLAIMLLRARPYWARRGR